MSYLGIVLTAAFASNALLTYGLGTIPEQNRKGGASLSFALALALVNLLGSTLLWLLRNLLLLSLNLAWLDILLFAILVVPLMKFLCHLVLQGNFKTGSFIFSLAERCDEMIVGTLVYGIALLSARQGYTIAEAALSSLVAGLGYWLAFFLLESLRERLELSDVPAPFRGAPIMLLSAGLMSLAFMGIDATVIKDIAGL